jgi:hypothetical protein
MAAESNKPIIIPVNIYPFLIRKIVSVTDYK